MEKAKCKGCKKEVAISKINKMGDKEYCPSCYEVAQNTESERRRLIGYISEIFKIPKPTGMMFAQIKNFNDEGIDYKTIRITLYYLVNIEKFKLDKKYGIGIVKYRYQDAMEYYKKAQKRKKEMEVIEYETNNIQMSFRDNNNRSKYLQSKIIDIDEISKGD